MITLGLHTGCIGGIFITGIFGNFYTKRGGIFDFQKREFPVALLAFHPVPLRTSDQQPPFPTSSTQSRSKFSVKRLDR